MKVSVHEMQPNDPIPGVQTTKRGISKMPPVSTVYRLTKLQAVEGRIPRAYEMVVR